ncbi:ASCH domain-containing protein [Candidatus Dojkabacteria bacterium]|nr:ASCH domain-containing protein [Candidatus Dojkabacteria bacterium]
MKTLKFYKNLCKLILKGEKNITWRLFDDKDLQVGDEVLFVVKETGREFVKARLVDIKEKTLGEIDDSDFDKHEKFSSEQEMYETYSKYYNCRVDENTPVKVIEFQVLEKIS